MSHWYKMNHFLYNYSGKPIYQYNKDDILVKLGLISSEHVSMLCCFKDIIVLWVMSIWVESLPQYKG